MEFLKNIFETYDYLTLKISTLNNVNGADLENRV